MKPATEPNESGIIETTTRRRVIPALEIQDPKPTDVWDYLRAIRPQDWAKHIVYVYRIEPGPKVQLFRCTEQISTTPGGQRVPIADEQELEAALTREFGGGVFRLLVKCGPQIVCAGNLEIGAPPRPIRIPVDNASNPSSSASTPTGGEAATVATQAFHAIGSARREEAEIGFGAMRLGMDAMRNAFEIRNAASTQPASETDQMFKMMMLKMMEKMIDKLDAPAAAAAANPNALTDRVISVALDRLLTNPSSTAPPVNTGAALVQMLPTIGSQFVEGLRAFATARENEAKIVAMQRTGAPGTPTPVNPQVLPPSSLPPNGSQPQPANGAPSVEFVDRKIIEFLKAPNLSAEQAADEAMNFLDTLDSGAVAQLAALGEEGLLKLFGSRPILAQAMSNTPRLIEFIRAFLRMHAEDVAAENGQPAVVPVKPPLPN